ncbi:MAG: polyprenyl synthetase family protein [Desulfovibrio sp.]|jgi:geranylgeranyl diphosphate synthase type II|nr:polyprenyl synthetase family protein [Desulfovibrio sp.]
MMSETAMKALLGERAAMVEEFLASCLDGFSASPRLRQAMLYSLQAGGKRLRPVLCLTCASLCGGSAETALPFACAIEMIHTYSLVHDDLPAMDNDDLRRGKPSNHKVFGEATAILAGDALLTDAFAVMCRTGVQADRLIRAVSTVALAAGSSGMAGGQQWDMLYTGRPAVALEELQRMHAMKTGALMRASCVCGALLAGADEEKVKTMGVFGAALGMAFQITDDILDLTADTASLGKPAGSDAGKGKNTYPSLVGMEKSRELACEQIAAAQAALREFSGRDAEFLSGLASYIIHRTA